MPAPVPWTGRTTLFLSPRGGTPGKCAAGVHKRMQVPLQWSRERDQLSPLLPSHCPCRHRPCLRRRRMSHHVHQEEESASFVPPLEGVFFSFCLGARAKPLETCFTSWVVLAHGRSSCHKRWPGQTQLPRCWPSCGTKWGQRTAGLVRAAAAGQCAQPGCDG